MASEQHLFIGFVVDDAVIACLDSCEERDKAFIEDPMYLEQLEIDDVRYIGKRMPGNCSQDRVEDTSRSVVSLLNRIDQVNDHKVSSIRIVAFEDTPKGEIFS